MKPFLSDVKSCIALAGILMLFIAFSKIPELWIASFGAFVLAVFVLGWQQAPPILVWIIAFNMLSIWADILNIEIARRGWASAVVELRQEDAIYYSVCALLFLAGGMRLGSTLGAGWVPLRYGSTDAELTGSMPGSPQRIALIYFGFIPIAYLAKILGELVSGLRQPLLAFGLLKFALIYWLAATTFGSNRNYKWLVTVIAVEIVLGSIGGWASYKEAFFVVLIALAGSNRRMGARGVGIALAGSVLIIYMSLVWTAVKDEFRSQILGDDLSTSASWLADKYFGGEVDFGDAAVRLLNRIGYTKFYAMVLNADTVSAQGIYGRAIVTTVTPRILFPDKPVLDDSKQTNEVLGWKIVGDTSIGLGYVAQAHIDFGFPGLLLPMVGLGTVVGLIYWYFHSRKAPLIFCDGFAVACLFNSLAFAANIDKELGALAMAFLVLMLVRKFGTQFLLRWMTSARTTPAMSLDIA